MPPLTTDRALVAERRQLGVETTPGTAVPTTKLLQAMSFDLRPDAEIDVYGPDGQKYDTVTILNKEWTSFPISGRPTYTELVYPLSGVLGAPVITTPGGATLARKWVWTPQVSAPDAVSTFTLMQGVPGGTAAERAAFGLITELGLQFSRNGGNEMSGAGIARPTTQDVALDTNEVQQVAITGGPTGGTFTITYAGQTTAAIPYNANAAAVQAALEALSNIAPGDVVVSGGALPGTPVVVEFRGTLAQTNVGQMTTTDSFTGGTAPASAVTTTTPGVAPTGLALVPIAPGHCDIYLDDTAAALGTTKWLRGFVYEWRIGDRFNPIYPLNSALSSFDNYIEAKPAPTNRLTVGNDPTGRGLLTTMRNNATKFMRLEATGPLIESGQNYRLRIDTAVKVAEPPDRGDEQSLSTLQWDFRIVYDATWAKAMEVELITSLTAL